MPLLHLVSVFDGSHLNHGIRTDDDHTRRGWSQPWDAPILGYSQAACAVNQSGELQVCAIEGKWTQPGRLKHAIRDVHNNWTAFGDVQAETSKVGPAIGSIAQVACATTVSDNLHVCLIDGTGKLWHTIRRASGDWPDPLGDVQAETTKVGPDRGQLSRVACAIGLDEELHVCAVDVDGGLWHTTRQANGTWTAFGDVQAETTKVGDEIGPVFSVGCAADENGELHLCTVNRAGQLWHTIRHVADSNWDGFGDVLAETGAFGQNPTTPLAEVACTTRHAQKSELHVCAMPRINGRNTDGQMWHTIRQPDRTWRQFTFVQEFARILGNAVNLSVSHD